MLYMETLPLEGVYTFQNSTYQNPDKGISLKLIKEDETHPSPFAIYLLEPEFKRIGRLFPSKGEKHYFNFIDDSGNKQEFLLSNISLTSYQIERIVR